MNYVGQLAGSVFVTVKELYQDLNPATLTGSIDVVVVRQPDNSFKCSPFHVRFGKLGVLRSREKVVDIEINGEPVDLHMKLGDNGEAFFVQESEENEDSIPFCLCTSPIPTEQSLKDSAQPSHGQEATGAQVTQCRRRWRRRKAKRKEVLGSESESCDETKGKMPVEEPCRLPAPSGAGCSSLADALEEEALSLQSPGVHPHSDGELASVDSFMLSHLSSRKSDSELEIKSQDSFALGTESHMQWTWGRLPQVNKLERVEPAKSTKTIATARTSISTTLVPVDEANPLAATSESLEGDPSPAGPQDIPCSSAVSVIETTLAPQDGNSIPSAEGAERLLGASSVPQEKQEEDGSVVPEVQPAVEPVEEATARRQVGSEGPEQQLERQRSQGSIKRSPHLGPSDIYLEELSKLEEKQVSLYLPRSRRRNTGDSEQSLRSVTEPSHPLCVQLPPSLPADTPPDCDSTPAVALSLCGGLRGSKQISHEKFMEHMVSYQQFAENPRLVNDPNLVILINNKYYNWAVAAPMVLSLQAFHRSIPESIIDDLVKEKMPKKGRRWWFWRRREFPAEEKQPKPGKANEGMLQPDSAQQRQEEEGSSSDDETLHSRDMLAIEAPAQKPLPTYKKSLRLSSEQIERLNLQDGPNEVAFSVTTQYQGTCRCEATIYLWNWDDKVVISDIDGTITKSDALGHILPHLGKDWTHHGIVKLFHKIHLNGYKFLYCSARAIGMAHITKGYLKWVNEQGCALPRGPILLAPSSLFSAFHREVIEKKPEVFKIACLRDIQNLFATKCPFHAAFGNRPNDVYAYKQVGLPESRIFTVNPRGELMQELTKNNKSTYERLSELVELIFPPLEQSGRAGLACPEYSHFSYWRPPLPDVDLDAAF
ncbi:LOW QUALITY PROTEIN: phosphatidate phosphatase LPIN3 [Myiozetetes cayanensis]|uniref:LOW QUALITY PROTEIN: phosphatidate phosphatase LPIN3 n=1 Tax=Myiozetetes cayanensis TaxID=478635 RepID=UPI00215E7D76|nr:LOW QUALITY PROTEIN: phosphatidate phosphatase LPIN3 [Myiozetetes cayanensis]